MVTTDSRVFLDTEFTVLNAHSELISLALVDQSGRAIYVERRGLRTANQLEWLIDNVLPHLQMPLDDGTLIEPRVDKQRTALYARGDLEHIGQWVREWLQDYTSVEFWVDMGSWDWVLFTSLFGGALQLPSHIQMYPIEFSTLLRAQGIPFDVDRAKLAPFSGQPHHALDDARHLAVIVSELENRNNSLVKALRDA